MKKVLTTLALSFLFSTPSFGSDLWNIDHAGVCRDQDGQYPRWSEYNWTLEQCEINCRNNTNCKAFAMSKDKNYCQLFGSDGSKSASPAYKEAAQKYFHGDSKQSGYTCFSKKCIGWLVDHTGVCRDQDGQYPRWSEYNWTLKQCETNCNNNSNCQGFAIAKDKNYCQLFGSDGSNPASPAYKEGTKISHGDSKQSGYACFIKNDFCIK